MLLRCWTDAAVRMTAGQTAQPLDSGLHPVAVRMLAAQPPGYDSDPGAGPGNVGGRHWRGGWPRAGTPDADLRLRRRCVREGWRGPLRLARPAAGGVCRSARFRWRSTGAGAHRRRCFGAGVRGRSAGGVPRDSCSLPVWARTWCGFAGPQSGFLPRTDNGDTPRNLMGFKDGTNNPPTHVLAAMHRFVWVGGEGPDWMQGGSYLVARRIHIALQRWDRMSRKLCRGAGTGGRQKLSGAPLGRQHEFDPIDLGATDHGGNPLVPENSHVLLASPGEQRPCRNLLRRPYSLQRRTEPHRRALGAGAPACGVRRRPVLHLLSARPAQRLHPDLRADGTARHE